ncbi:MutL C terminal dimerization domain-containing protein [Crepidotus variabilis]|uniref:MutL C terminal dimerization domain-containing protein n=1 Tax=Crepidotus variabilis TaxID=179855 RepID=A0A9P6JRZ8_9AGAR|nr:MutL C terminal dimerization domain-containing protein [Crepidotus variabilis]
MDELKKDLPPQGGKAGALDSNPPLVGNNSPENPSPISESPHHNHPKTLDNTQTLFLEDDEDEDPNSILSQAKATSSVTSTTVSSKNSVIRPEIIRTEKAGSDIVVRFNIDNVGALWNLKTTQSSSFLDDVVGGEVDAKKLAVPVEASILNIEDGDNAERALSRIINKTDFNSMEVVGQFNLGFIIARRRTRNSGVEVDKKMDDLFIVDQHAADEKYNFENLQATTKIEAQKLVRPRPLELPAADEMLVIENLEVLRQSGFEIMVDEDASESHGRLKLSAMPISKNTVFDVKDLEEILHLMRNRPTGQIVRCSKARAMFAMRACRKSVMVGMPLNSAQMTSVVRHMGTMDQPWNCPHGRPTMRHLCDIRSSGIHPKDKIDWSML